MFDWEAGDFGDRDSCLGEQQAKDIIANGGLIRCFESEAGRGDREGGWPHSHDMFVLFNGYGKSAREFACWFCGMEFDPVSQIEQNCSTNTVSCI